MTTSSTPELIAVLNDRLTPTERRIAEAVLAEPTLLAFGTVSDLAERVGTSRPSIVRFANKLGFDGYTDLQAHERTGLSQRLTRPSDRIRHDAPTAVRERSELITAIDAVFDAVDGGRMQAYADLIIGAEKLWIVSGETSRAGAITLHSGLTMLRPGVILVGDHSMGRDLSDAGAGDTAVIFDFFRYRHTTVVAAKALASVGASIVAITDGPLSPLAAITDTWCQIRVPAIGPFDSSVPAVAIADLLIAQVARDLREEAKERIDRTEALWEVTETFIT